jgi:nucleoside-diphosphate-sugar epimerase
MRILVIGATGYVGRSVVRRLRGDGHEVAGLARNDAAAAKLAEAGAAVVAGDVSDPVTIAPTLGDFEAVIYAAQTDMRTERIAVETLLGALEGTGTRFVLTTGTAVLAQPCGGDWTEESFAEDDPFVPSAYAGVRCETENLVRAAVDRGISGNVVRPPLIWGYGRCPPLSALHGSARSGAVCYLGRGLGAYSSVHVDDLADVFALVLEKGVPGALYHAVSGETNWRSLAEEVARLRGLPTRSVGYEEARELFGPFVAHVVFAHNSRTRCPRTRQELGWSPSPDRLDIFAEMGHPNLMALSGASGDRYHFIGADPTASTSHGSRD